MNVAKNTLAQVLGRGGVILTTVLTTALLTRSLGVDGYGSYVFIISIVMLFVAIADWGTALIFVRETVKEGVAEEKFFGNALLFRLLLALIAFLIMNLLFIFVAVFKELAVPLRIASVLLILLSLKTSTHIIFQTKLKFEYIAFTDILISLFYLVTLFLLWFVSPLFLTLNLILGFYALANFFGLIAAFLWAKNLSKISLRPNRLILRRIILETIPTGALLLTFSIYNRLDIFLLQSLQGSQAVGFYGLAYKVHDNLVLGAAYLTASLFPLLSTIAHQERESLKLKSIYRKTFDILLGFGLIMLLTTYFLAPVIINLIGGPSFGQSALVLRVLVLATFIAYFNHLTGYTLIALGKQRVSLTIAVLALVWNLGLNVIFIPRYSYMAATVITITTEGLVFLLTSFYLAKRFQLTPALSLFKTWTELIKLRGKIF